MCEKIINRCQWLNTSNLSYTKYHDTEWGVPVHSDNKLFEMLILEGAQAGLSWETILKKRENYQKALFYFDIEKCSKITEAFEIELMNNADIIRNKLKIKSIKINALAFIGIQKEYKSFDNYLWKFVGYKPLNPKYKTISEIPVRTELSDKISKELKEKGMKFIGTTIIQSYMQAIGIINSHTTDCFRYKDLAKK